MPPLGTAAPVSVAVTRKPKEPAMRRAPFVELDFCDFVTFTLASIAFLLGVYVEVGI